MLGLTLGEGAVRLPSSLECIICRIVVGSDPVRDGRPCGRASLEHLAHMALTMLDDFSTYYAVSAHK